MYHRIMFYTTKLQHANEGAPDLDHCIDRYLFDECNGRGGTKAPARLRRFAAVRVKASLCVCDRQPTTPVPVAVAAKF